MKSNDKYKRPLVFILSLMLWLIVTGVWAYVWMKYYGTTILRPFGYKGNGLVFMVYGLILFIFNRTYGGYKVGYYKGGDVILSGILSTTVTNIITYLQVCLISRKITLLNPFIIMTLVDMIIIALWGCISNNIYFKIFPPRKILMVYGEIHQTERLFIKIRSRKEKYNICETINVEKGLDSIYNKIKEYDSVLLCDIKSETRNKILKYCFDNNIRTYITPKISDIILKSSDNINLFDTPLIMCRNQGLTLTQRFTKRTMDLVISGIGIIVLSPFMFLIAIAIKLQDGGPVLFKQKRCTINNKQFEIYKFRSMIIDAEKDGKSKPCINNDPRITRVGGFIRKTRLDELPQLFNIFKGDMSIVGPRPERIEHVEKYSETIPEFSFRCKVKGGLTGYAQVFGKYNTTAYDKLKLDLMYIQSYSLLLDIKLILMTIKVIFMKESTEGFDNLKFELFVKKEIEQIKAGN